MESFRRAVVLRILAILGFFLAVFLRPPLSVATLSLIEPILIAVLLTSWFTGYYVAASVAKKSGSEAIPLLRRFLPGHILIADGLKLLVLVLAVVFVWSVWSLQPFRIFNATVLITLWIGLGAVNALTRYRRRPALDGKTSIS
jgi:hypothetical protein